MRDHEMNLSKSCQSIWFHHNDFSTERNANLISGNEIHIGGREILISGHEILVRGKEFEILICGSEQFRENEILISGKKLYFEEKEILISGI